MSITRLPTPQGDGKDLTRRCVSSPVAGMEWVRNTQLGLSVMSFPARERCPDSWPHFGFREAASPSTPSLWPTRRPVPENQPSAFSCPSSHTSAPRDAKPHGQEGSDTSSGSVLVFVFVFCFCFWKGRQNLLQPQRLALKIIHRLLPFVNWPQISLYTIQGNQSHNLVPHPVWDPKKKKKVLLLPA